MPDPPHPSPTRLAQQSSTGAARLRPNDDVLTSWICRNAILSKTFWALRVMSSSCWSVQQSSTSTLSRSHGSWTPGRSARESNPRASETRLAGWAVVVVFLPQNELFSEAIRFSIKHDANFFISFCQYGFANVVIRIFFTFFLQTPTFFPVCNQEVERDRKRTDLFFRFFLNRQRYLKLNWPFCGCGVGTKNFWMVELTTWVPAPQPKFVGQASCTYDTMVFRCPWTKPFWSWCQ